MDEDQVYESPETGEVVIEDEGIDSGSEDIEDNEYQEEQAEGGEQEAEFEEYELDGKVYKVPAEVKPYLLRQADYTKKTQEVAEQRRILESQRQEIEKHVQLQQATFQEAAKVAAMDEQIAQFNQLDWANLSQQDPVKAQELFFQFSQLKDQRNAAATQINAKMQQKALEEQQSYAKRLEDSEAVLRREIPNWSPAVEKQLYDTGVELGFSDQELKMIAAEPRIVKLIYAQMKLNQIGRKDSAKPQVKPVTTIKPKGSIGKKDPSEMSDAEFEKWRRNTIKARRN